MSKKIEITKNQAQQYNRMFETLRKIAKCSTDPILAKQKAKTIELAFDTLSDWYDDLRVLAYQGAYAVRKIEFDEDENKTN